MTAYTMHIITVWRAHTDVEKLHTVHVDEGCGTHTSPLLVICHTTENVSLSYGGKPHNRECEPILWRQTTQQRM